MFCPYCGARLVDGAKFCNTCGKGIEWPEGYGKQEENRVTQEEFAAFQAEKEAQEKTEYEAWKQSRAAAFEAQQPQTPVEPFPTEQNNQNARTQYTATTTATPSASEDAEAKSAMIWSIIGAALAELGLPGLIISLVARGKIQNLLNKYGKLRGKGNAAKWINLGGRIASIFMTVFWTLYILLLIVAVISASKGGQYYGYYY